MTAGFWESGIEQAFGGVAELMTVVVDVVVVVVRRLEKMNLLTCERALCCNKILYEPKKVFKLKNKI